MPGSKPHGALNPPFRLCAQAHTEEAIQRRDAAHRLISRRLLAKRVGEVAEDSDTRRRRPAHFRFYTVEVGLADVCPLVHALSFIQLGSVQGATHPIDRY